MNKYLALPQIKMVPSQAVNPYIQSATVVLKAERVVKNALNKPVLSGFKLPKKTFKKFNLPADTFEKKVHSSAPKNVIVNKIERVNAHGDKQAVASYFDNIPQADAEKQAAKMKWYEDVAKELELKDRAKQAETIANYNAYGEEVKRKSEQAEADKELERLLQVLDYDGNSELNLSTINRIENLLQDNK